MTFVVYPPVGVAAEEVADELVAGVREVLAEVRLVTDDWTAMRQQLSDAVDLLGTAPVRRPQPTTATLPGTCSAGCGTTTSRCSATGSTPTTASLHTRTRHWSRRAAHPDGPVRRAPDGGREGSAGLHQGLGTGAGAPARLPRLRGRTGPRRRGSDHRRAAVRRASCRRPRTPNRSRGSRSSCPRRSRSCTAPATAPRATATRRSWPR
jgi:hypothetical protein